MKAIRGSIGSPARRRQPWSLAALLLAAAGAACGDEPEPASAPTSPGAAAPGGEPRTRVAKKTLDPATAGSISGVVRVEGQVPEPKFIQVVGEAFCLQSHEGGGFLDDRVLVSNGGLANAFVWIAEGLADYEFEAPEESVILDQQRCLFVPRVLGVMLDQPIVSANGDPILHNVHSKPDHNPEQNLGSPAGSAPQKLRFRRPEVMVEVVCDVHAWMKAWIGVLEHPCFAVSRPDGTFTIEGVPPGKHTLGVWHEKLGEKRVPVTVAEGQAAALPPVVFRP